MKDLEDKLAKSVTEKNLTAFSELISDPKFDILTSEIIPKIFYALKMSEDSKEDENDAMIAKEFIKVINENSNSILLNNIEEMSVEDLHLFLEKDGLSYLSYKLFETLLDNADTQKIRVLIGSKYNNLTLEQLYEIEATCSVFEALNSSAEELKEALSNVFLVNVIKEYLLTNHNLPDENLKLLAEKNVYSVLMVLKNLVHSNINDFEVKFDELQSFLTKEDKSNLLIESAEKRREIVYNFLLQHVDSIPEEVGLTLLMSEREAWFLSVMKDERFTCDVSKFPNYARGQKDFESIMENKKIAKYVKENEYEFAKSMFLKKYLVRKSVRNKMADF